LEPVVRLSLLRAQCPLWQLGTASKRRAPRLSTPGRLAVDALARADQYSAVLPSVRNYASLVTGLAHSSADQISPGWSRVWPRNFFALDAIQPRPLEPLRNASLFNGSQQEESDENC
jgi:hypothetical protein